MFEPSTDTSRGTVRIWATGEIERDDYDDVLTPELSRGLQARRELRMPYLIDDVDDGTKRRADSKLRFRPRRPPPLVMGAAAIATVNR
jgi:hypothetical protein